MADAATVFEVEPQELTGNSANPSGRRHYMVTGTTDVAVAYGLVGAYADLVWEGLWRQDIQPRELGGGNWDFTVQYGVMGAHDPDNPENSTTWSFEINTETTHITHGLEHIESWPAGTAPDHKGAIGVQDSGGGKTVEGCDIYIPIFTWEETHWVDYTVITPAYIQTLESLIATTNEGPFRIWGEREILFLGVSGSKRAESPVGLTYRFAKSRSRTNMTIGTITSVDKKGWEYLWVEYEKADDGSNNLTARPKAVHVERVYDDGDFSDLGLWDPFNH